MTLASLGIVGGLATAGASQRAAEADKLPRDASDQARATDAARRAEDAAGIGHTEEDSQASDRDADGRRLWEQPAPPQPAPQPPTATAADACPLAKDPTGDCGRELDLVG